MKKVLVLLLSSTLLISCADDKRYAPKEGRISIFEKEAVQTTTAQVKIANPIQNKTWIMPFYNIQNNQPNLIVNQIDKPIWDNRISKASQPKNNTLPTTLVNVDAIYQLDNNYALTKTDLQSGKQLWQLNLAKNKQGLSLALSNKTVLALSTDGVLTAVSLDGKQLWQKDLQVTTRAPLVADNTSVYLITTHNQFIVLNIQNGNELWRYQTTKTNTGLTTMAPPAKKDNILVVPFATGEVIAFDADSGLLTWIQMLVGNRPQDLTQIPQIAAAPVIDDTTVYLTGNANLTAAYDLYSGETKWTNDFASIITPIISGNTLFLITTNNELLALEKTTGKIFWRKTIHPDENTTWHSLSLINNQLVLTTTNKMVFINVENGQTEQIKKKSVYAKPVVANGFLTITDKKNNIQVY